MIPDGMGEGLATFPNTRTHTLTVAHTQNTARARDRGKERWSESRIGITVGQIPYTGEYGRYYCASTAFGPFDEDPAIGYGNYMIQILSNHKCTVIKIQ